MSAVDLYSRGIRDALDLVRQLRVRVVTEERKARGRYRAERALVRSEEHTSELQSLMRTSHAVLCLHKQPLPPLQPLLPIRITTLSTPLLHTSTFYHITPAP